MKVWELLSDPTKWTKEAFAKKENGKHTYSRDPKACCWCLSGAITVCYPNYPQHEVRDKVAIAVGLHTCIAEWNDRSERTYEEVFNLAKRLDI